MGQEERNREDSLWLEFSETGKMPSLPESFISDNGKDYAFGIMNGNYNQLTKVLLGELLAKQGLLDANGMDAHLKAAEWIKPMIFSKKRNYAKCFEMGKSFEMFAMASSNPKVVNLVSKDINFQKAWDWAKRGKDECSRCNNQSYAEQTSLFVKELFEISKTDAWGRIVADRKLFSLILFWLGKLLVKTQGKLSGSKYALAVLRKVDSESLPEECYVRKAIEPKPEKGSGYYPSTLEELARGVYSVFKNQERIISVIRKPWLEWAAKFLVATYSRFDDEWGNYRIGKLLLWSGNLEEAKAHILPIARKKSSEFWIWGLMSDLFPEHRVNCIARALLCPGDEKYMGCVKSKGANLNMPLDDMQAMKQLSESADELLLEGLTPVKGNFEKSFIAERDGKKKPRVCFVAENGVSPKPISPIRIHYPRKTAYGTPVWLYLTKENELIAVKMRPDGMLWDALPSVEAIYYGKSKGGSFQFTDGKREYVARGDMLSKTQRPELGSAYIIRYTRRKKDDRIVFDVRSAVPTNSTLQLTGETEGTVRYGNVDSGTAFVNDIFVPPEIANQMREKNVDAETPVKITYVQISPQKKTSQFGRSYDKKRFNAISFELLYGEELERYQHEHKPSDI